MESLLSAPGYVYAIVGVTAFLCAILARLQHEHAQEKGRTLPRRLRSNQHHKNRLTRKGIVSRKKPRVRT